LRYKKERRKSKMEEIKRREFLKTGAATLGAASLGMMAAGVAGRKGVAEAADAPEYKIFALKYAGPFTGSVAMVFFNKEWDKTIQRNYYIWAVQGGGKTIVFDSGVRPALAAERKLAGYVSPDQALARIGIDAKKVEHLVISHIHFDHGGGIELFPNAKIYVQRKEFDFWVYDPISRRPPYAAVADPVANKQFGDLRGSDRLVFIDGDQKILPGIELLLTPGHTPALQSMAVNTTKGLAILCSDCAHIHRSFVEDNPSCLITDLPAWLNTYTRLRDKVKGNLSMLFAGHEKDMLEKYPKVAEDVTQLI
jgi:glyoxylase-like metal-dependent hydrolase (beta-lactamase superfamily II)